MKKLLILSLGLFMFMSCSSNEEKISNEDEIILPKKIVVSLSSGEQSVIELKYDGNKIIEEKHSGEILTKYFYENDILTKVISDGNKTELFYNSDKKLIKYQVTYSGETSVSQVYELTHNGDGTITEVLNGTSTRILTFKDGNLIDDEDYKYEYDTKNASSKNVACRESFINVDFIGLIGMNNIIKTTPYNSGGDATVETVEYTYNDKNYPVAGKKYDDGVLSETYEIFY